MKTEALDDCLRISLAHASLTLKLDDVLGTFHGLSLNDFIVLRLLSQAEGGRLPLAGLMRPLGVRMSAVLRQLAPLEKTGHLQREPGRMVALRPAGRALMAEAAGNAEAVCSDALAVMDGAARESLRTLLSQLCRSSVLELT
ncbi:MAG: AsnC family transcriptional regulator [Hydrogenophaga sp.]|nr:AsnC family transcriptional regulator [Hydrogenophaga sp.]MDP3607231.1 AsnC family transcriptional regulator [Polaromonas sp.]